MIVRILTAPERAYVTVEYEHLHRPGPGQYALLETP